MKDGAEFDTTRIASAKSFRRAMRHVPTDGYILVNRISNLNVYDRDYRWLGIINLENTYLHDTTRPDEEPVAHWEDVGEEWR